MKVKVKFLGVPQLLSDFEGKKEVEVQFSGDTLKDLFHQLFINIGPKKRNIFFNKQGEISPDLLILINGIYISGSNRLNEKVRENDLIQLALFSG